MGLDAPVHPVMHGPDIKRALECPKAALFILQHLILVDNLFRVQGFVGGLKNKLAVYLVFPPADSFIRLPLDDSVVIQPQAIVTVELAVPER